MVRGWRAVFAVLGCSVLLAGALSIGVRALLIRRLARLEEQEAHQHVERAQSALTAEIFSLAEMAEDYATWNDAYVYMEKRSPAFLKEGLPTAAHSSLRVHVVVLFDNAGQVVFGRSLDLEKKLDGPLPPGLEEHLRSPRLRERHNGQPGVQGIVLVHQTPLLVASRPILTSEGGGPARGTLLVGRWLDDWQLEKLTRDTQLTLAFVRFDDAKASADVVAARRSLSAQARPLIRPRDEDSISGYALITDLYEKPALVLRVDAYRRIYKEGLAAASYLTAALMVTGLVCGALSLVLTRWLSPSPGALAKKA